MPTDYSKGQIYVIRAPGTDRIYIGSTTLPLESRLGTHRHFALRGGSGGCRSRELVTIPGHTIELLEAYPCASAEELRKREGWHIRQNAATVVNKNIAGRTPAEYLADNAALYRERALAWYYANKDRRREYEAKTRDKRLAYQRVYYQTVVKPKKLAQRAAAEAAACGEEPTSTTATTGLLEALAAWEAAETAALNPTSVAVASSVGV